MGRGCAAEHFGARGLVEAAGFFEAADGFEEVDGAGDVVEDGGGGVFEGDLDVALCGEVIDFVGLDFVDDSHESEAVVEVAIVGEEGFFVDGGVVIDVVDAGGGEGGGAAFDGVDLVAFGEEETEQVSAVLSCDTSDEGFFQMDLCGTCVGRYIGVLG